MGSSMTTAEESNTENSAEMATPAKKALGDLKVAISKLDNPKTAASGCDEVCQTLPQCLKDEEAQEAALKLVEQALLKYGVELKNPRGSKSSSAAAKLLEMVFPMMWVDKQPVREVALRVVKMIPTDPRPECWNKLKTDMHTEYCKSLLNMVVTVQKDWPTLWTETVKFFGNDLHNGANLINQLLGVLEKAYKNPDVEWTRVQAFECWRALIDSFKKASLNPKRVALILIPLRASNHRTEALTKAKYDTFMHLIRNLPKTEDMYNTLRAFLSFCFCSSGDTLLPLRSYVSLQPLCFQALEVAVTRACQSKCVSRLTKLLVQAFSQCLQLPDVDEEKVKKSWVMLLEHISEAKGCDTNRNLIREMLTMLDDLVTLSAGLTRSPAVSPSSSSSVSSMSMNLSQSSSPPQEELGSLLADLLYELIVGPSALTASQLASLSLYVGNNLMSGTPALMAVQWLLSPGILLSTGCTEKYKAMMNHLINASLECLGGPLSFIPKVLKMAAKVISTQSDSTSVIESLTSTWCSMAEVLVRWVNAGGELNQGDAANHDFSCLYAVVEFPVTQLFTNTSSWIKVWGQLYQKSAPQVALVSTTGSHEFCDQISSRLTAAAKSDCPKNRDAQLAAVVACGEAMIRAHKATNFKWGREQDNVVTLLSEVVTNAAESKSDELTLALARCVAQLENPAPLCSAAPLVVEKLASVVLLLLQDPSPSQHLVQPIVSALVTIKVILEKHWRSPLDVPKEVKTAVNLLVTCAGSHSVRNIRTIGNSLASTICGLAPDESSSSEPQPMVVGSILHPRKDVVGSKTASPKLKTTPTNKSTFSPLNKSPVDTPTRRNKRKLDEALEQFVVIKRPTPVKMVLTEHQKEVLRRKADIPALYQDLSQDTQSASQDCVILPSSPANLPIKGRFQREEEAVMDFEDIIPFKSTSKDLDTSVSILEEGKNKKMFGTIDIDDNATMQSVSDMNDDILTCSQESVMAVRLEEEPVSALQEKPTPVTPNRRKSIVPVKKEPTVTRSRNMNNSLVTRSGKLLKSRQSLGNLDFKSPPKVKRQRKSLPTANNTVSRSESESSEENPSTVDTRSPVKALARGRGLRAAPKVSEKQQTKVAEVTETQSAVEVTEELRETEALKTAKEASKSSEETLSAASPSTESAEQSSSVSSDNSNASPDRATKSNSVFTTPPPVRERSRRKATPTRKALLLFQNHDNVDRVSLAVAAKNNKASKAEKVEQPKSRGRTLRRSRSKNSFDENDPKPAEPQVSSHKVESKDETSKKSSGSPLKSGVEAVVVIEKLNNFSEPDNPAQELERIPESDTEVFTQPEGILCEKLPASEREHPATKLVKPAASDPGKAPATEPEKICVSESGNPPISKFTEASAAEPEKICLSEPTETSVAELKGASVAELKEASVAEPEKNCISEPEETAVSELTEASAAQPEKPDAPKEPELETRATAEIPSSDVVIPESQDIIESSQALEVSLTGITTPRHTESLKNDETPLSAKWTLKVSDTFTPVGTDRNASPAPSTPKAVPADERGADKVPRRIADKDDDRSDSMPSWMHAKKILSPGKPSRPVVKRISPADLVKVSQTPSEEAVSESSPLKPSESTPNSSPVQSKWMRTESATPSGRSPGSFPMRTGRAAHLLGLGQAAAARSGEEIRTTLSPSRKEETTTTTASTSPAPEMTAAPAPVSVLNTTNGLAFRATLNGHVIASPRVKRRTRMGLSSRFSDGGLAMKELQTPGSEWIRKIYQPDATPETGILKKPRRTPAFLESDGSPSNRKKRVSFHDPPVSKSLNFFHTSEDEYAGTVHSCGATGEFACGKSPVWEEKKMEASSVVWMKPNDEDNRDNAVTVIVEESEQEMEREDRLSLEESSVLRQRNYDDKDDHIRLVALKEDRTKRRDDSEKQTNDADDENRWIDGRDSKIKKDDERVGKTEVSRWKRMNEVDDDLSVMKDAEEERSRNDEEERLRKAEEGERLKMEEEKKEKIRREEERVRQEEEERVRRKEGQLRKEEEKERLRSMEEERILKEEEEERRRQVEERIHKEEEEKLQEEERIRKEEEEKLQEEERIRKEEEEKLQEEERIRKEEEEEKRQEEERIRKEEEEEKRQEEERIRKEEEEEKRQEEERLRKEEEEKKRQEEERICKEEKKKKRLEAERIRREEAEKKRLEERIRKDEEEKKRQEERIRKDEEEKKRQEERIRKDEEEKKRQEERIRKEREERIREDEEEMKRLAETIRKEMEETLRKVEEEKRLEEEEKKRLEEEKIRQAEEEKRQEEERARKEEEEKKRQEEERIRKEEDEMIREEEKKRIVEEKRIRKEQEEQEKLRETERVKQEKLEEQKKKAEETARIAEAIKEQKRLGLKRKDPSKEANDTSSVDSRPMKRSTRHGRFGLRSDSEESSSSSQRREGEVSVVTEQVADIIEPAKKPRGRSKKRNDDKSRRKVEEDRKRKVDELEKSDADWSLKEEIRSKALSETAAPAAAGSNEACPRIDSDLSQIAAFSQGDASVTHPILFPKPGAVYPSLIDCEEPVDKIINLLTGAAWRRNLLRKFADAKLTTLGHLASLTEEQVNRYAIRPPRKETLVRALEKYERESGKAKPLQIPSQRNIREPFSPGADPEDYIPLSSLAVPSDAVTSVTVPLQPVDPVAAVFTSSTVTSSAVPLEPEDPIAAISTSALFKELSNRIGVNEILKNLYEKSEADVLSAIETIPLSKKLLSKAPFEDLVEECFSRISNINEVNACNGKLVDLVTIAFEKDAILKRTVSTLVSKSNGKEILEVLFKSVLDHL